MLKRQLLAATLALSTAGAAAQGPPAGFIEVVPTQGVAPVWLAAAQVVRIGRVETYTVIDTAAWVQQRSIEPAEAVARRLSAAGQRFIGLTDLSNHRTFLSADRIVLVRGAQGRYAEGARSAIVMVGLRFGTDVAVRESVEEVIAALRALPSRDGAP
jgi:hypothetical protein